jgi:hypothetical protein
LQIRLKRFVSLDETIRWLLAKKDKTTRQLLPKLREKKPRKRNQVHINMNREIHEKRREIS